MKKLFQEFKAFINKGNALALAIGVIIGGSFTAIVTAINKNVISPLIGALCGDNDLSQSLVTVLSYKKDINGDILVDEAGEQIIENAIYWGSFIQAVIDFLLTAIILFAIFKIASAISSYAKKTAERAKALLSKEEEQEVVEEVVEEVKPAEPTMEEKQLALLQSINDHLVKLNEPK